MKNIIAVLLLSAVAFAQGGVQNNAALKSSGQPAAGASVRVCTFAATGTPCLPLASIYSDNALTIPKSNPFTADSYGNYSYFALPGLYKEQVTVGTTTHTSFIQIGIDANHITFGDVATRAIGGIRFADQFCAVAGTYDQTCINNAITDVEVGGTVIVPYHSNWLLTGTINITKAVTLDCSMGWSNTIRVASSVNASTDVVHVYGATMAIEGGGIKNCQFLPQSGTPGRYGLHIDTTNYGISKFEVKRNYFGRFGASGFHLTNPVLTTGFFNSTIAENAFYGGTTWERVGDNVSFHDNTISGSGIGIDATQVQGSMNFEVRHNSITSTGACMHFGDGFSNPFIKDNICEGSVSLTGSNSATLDLDGSVGWPMIHPVVTGNNIAAVASGVDGIRVNYATDAVIDGSRVHRAGSAKSIRVTANAVAGSTQIGCYNNYDPRTDSQTTILADAGASSVCWNNPYSQTSQGGRSGGLDLTRTIYTPYLYANSIANTRYADQFATGSTMGGIDQAYADGPSTGVHVVLAQDITISSAQTLTLTIGKPLWLDLNGRKITCTNTSGVCLKIQKPDATPRYSLEITNGTITYSGSSASITGLMIGNGAAGATTNAAVRGVTFNGFSSTGGIALDLNNCEDCSLEGNSFNQNQLALNVEQDSNNNHYSSNWFQDNVNNFVLTDVQGQTFIDNLFESASGTTPHRIVNAARDIHSIIFLNNWFENNGDTTANSRQIYMGETAGLTFRYITFSGNTFNGGTNGTAGSVYEVAGAGLHSGTASFILKSNSYSITTRFTGFDATVIVSAEGEGSPNCSVCINVTGISDLTPNGLIFANFQSSRNFQIWQGTTGLSDGVIGFRDITNHVDVLTYDNNWNFLKAVKFENGGVVAGYSDTGTTNTWSISNATGKGTFNGGVQPAATADAITWFKKATHATLDLASVASGAISAIQTETITGAALGDSCNVSSAIALEDGGQYVCNVTATDTVKWYLKNNSGGAIDRASDTYTIRVTR